LLERLAGLIDAHRPPHPLRVALDGPDAAGKTTLADELADRLGRRRQVIRASADDFQRPRAERYRRGALSPDGYYLDAFDTDAIQRVLLGPLGPRGDRRYRVATFDYRSDVAVGASVCIASDDAILLFDGVFLLRPELRDGWDLAVHVDVSPAETLRRALRRDGSMMGGADEARRLYVRRYLPAQRRYVSEAAPSEHAEVVIDNEDVRHPCLRKWPATGSGASGSGASGSGAAGSKAAQSDVDGGSDG
jgi:uridine kinase